MGVYKRRNVISLAEQKAYWQKQLCGELPVLEVPLNYLRSQVQSFVRAKEAIKLDEQCLVELQKFCTRENVTLFITLLTTFKVLLLRYTGQEDIIVGSMSVDSMRKVEESGGEEFANLVALRTNLTSPLNAKELIMRVARTVAGAVENRDYPFEALVEDVSSEEYLTRAPIFQVMLILCNVPCCISETPISKVELAKIEERSVRCDVVVLAFEEGGVLNLSCEYNAELFEPALIRRMLRHFQTLLSSIVANPDRCISTLPLLTKAERHQLLVEWNDTKAEYPQSKCVHQLFEAQVERTPDAVAVVFEEQQLTYRELNTKANQLAHYLQASGVGPEVLVGICTERSLEMIVGLLGILKAGGAYVPLDPTYPFESLSFILEDVQPPVLLTQKRLLEEIPSQWDAQVICLDSDWEAIAQESVENPVSKLTVENLVYVIYTSGSTGMPKGVMIAHQGLCNREPEFRLYHVRPDNRVLQFASLSFDTSVSEVFMALLAGAALCLEQDSLLLGPALINVLRNKGITTVTLPPSVLATLPAEEFPALQTLIAAGEACTANLVATWGPGRRFLNAYGPTEATVCATVAECVDDNHKPPIGRPVPNKQVYLLDQHFQLVPIGVPGELYIGGVGLARGYLNRPELTAEKFIPNPFSQKPGARLYKTGDLACYLPDGKIEFLGRIDHQVKLRGFRIELGEIEAVLVQHTGVRETVVITRDYAPGDQRLVAYVIPHQQVPTTSELRRFLKQKLPDYMIPSAFLLLDALPLTPNGKVDRRALPVPDQARPEQEGAFIAPQDTLEHQLTKIWEQVLGIQPIGVTDNFFELGGNSLLAVRLFAQIQEVFGKALPLATLFQAPTSKQLTNILRSEGFSAPIQSLVPLKLGGKKPPLFCIRGILHYHDLARHLPPDQPVYGVYLQDEVELLLAGRLEKQLSVLTSVAELATQYLKEIQTLHPVGPYFLAGESFGGLVAFEMAQQLHVQGEKVAMLALFDTQAPGAVKKLLWRERVCLHLGNLFREGFTYALKKAKFNIDESQDRLVSTISKIHRKFNQSLGLPWIGYLQEVAQPDIRDQVVAQARANYLPRPYLGKVILFRALERDKFDPYYTDPQLGWGELPIGELAVHHVPGAHLTMLREPHVRVLAERLTDCLDKAQANM